MQGDENWAEDALAVGIADAENDTRNQDDEDARVEYAEEYGEEDDDA